MRKSFTLALAGIVAIGAILFLTRCGGDDPIPADKAVSVAAQQGTITAGTAGEAAFAVTTANIADGKGGTVTWYTTAEGTTTASAPAGIAPSVTDVASDAAEVTMAATSAAQEGTYYFKVAIDGAVSNTAALRVSPEGGESNELNGTTWLMVELNEGVIGTMTLEFTSDTDVTMIAASGGISEDIPDGTYNGTYTYTPPIVSFYFDLLDGESELTVDLEVSGNMMGGHDIPLFLKQTGDATQEYHVIVSDDDGRSGGDGWADKIIAAAGETVSLGATPDNDYVFNRWTALMGDITLSPDANTPNATFTMPASAVIVMAEFGTLTDLGVTIGGITWATRNVDMPGTFAANPEDAGMFYKWGRNVGWSSTDPIINSDGGTAWDYFLYDGNVWLSENDPCPEGWRVPTVAELQSLIRASNYEWTTVNGKTCVLFTDKTATAGSILLPAAGWRNHNVYGQLTNANHQGLYYGNTLPEGGNILGFIDNAEIIPKTVEMWVGGRASAHSVRCVGETSELVNTMTLTTTAASINHLRLLGSGGVVVDWGDGSSNSYTFYSESYMTCTHTYTDSATRTITITGSDITRLVCQTSGITSLNVLSNPKLEVLDCTDNKLQHLEVNGLANLTHLFCNFNQLTSLNVNGCTMLQVISCNANLLTNLDASGLAYLYSLGCQNNRLVSLDVSGCTDLGYLYLGLQNNHMTGAALDALFGMLPTRPSGDEDGKIDIANNGGSDGTYDNTGTTSCSPSIATAKNWIVDTTTPAYQ